MLQRHARLDPGVLAAIQHRGLAMADPAQQPPQARGEHAALRVVGHHRGVVVHAQRLQPRDEVIGVGQGMAAVAATFAA
ncbi:hypothetical protein D3C80_1794990 [compost metagenome]